MTTQIDAETASGNACGLSVPGEARPSGGQGPARVLLPSALSFSGVIEVTVEPLE